MAAIPDRVYIDKEDRALYEKVENANVLEFKKKGRKEQFLLAMAIGTQDDALMNAIAVYETNSPDVLSNKEEVFKIAEEYAHAGIKLLVDKIETTEFTSFHRQFEKELHEIYDRVVTE